MTEPSTHSAAPYSAEDQNPLDLAEIWARLRRGLPHILGLTGVGILIAVALFVLTSPFQILTTTTRVVFSFPGYDRGEYPDHSKFQPDDFRAPDVVHEAIVRQKLDESESFQSLVRSGLSIEGVIPPNIVKERDRLRAAGQPPPQFVPDEYIITFSLKREHLPDARQRERLLNEIVSVYREKFQRTYVELPLSFGNAFETLKGADFFEYELVLSEEIKNMTNFLTQQAALAKTFRSPSTNLSYSDLIKQSNLFAQIRLNETLGFIRQNGLSKNRANAMVKMDYYLRILEDREAKAVEEEKVVQTLLEKTQVRGQGYLLGVKSQAAQPRTDSPFLDQGLIDSLLANDSYNFLVREALKAGLKVKEVQAEKAVLLERRRTMDAFLHGEVADQSAIISQTQASLVELETGYRSLVNSIRRTHADYQRQTYADSIRVSMQAFTPGFYGSLGKAALAGLGAGLIAGISFILLGTSALPRRS